MTLKTDDKVIIRSSAIPNLAICVTADKLDKKFRVPNNGFKLAAREVSALDTSHQWIVKFNEKTGNYMFESVKYPGYYMDKYGASKHDNRHMVLYKGNNTDAQLFKLVTTNNCATIKNTVGFLSCSSDNPDVICTNTATFWFFQLCI